MSVAAKFRWLAQGWTATHRPLIVERDEGRTRLINPATRRMLVLTLADEQKLNASSGARAA